jgi:uncharacterized protein YbjT (DUF2867 family)
VRHLVKISGVLASRPTFNQFAEAHAAIEKKLVTSGIPATILRPNWFMENFLGSAESVAKEGAIYGAAGDSKVAFVDGRDIAAVAVVALTEEGHAGKTYVVTGPEPLTFAEAAGRIGTGIGRNVAFMDMSEEAFESALSGAGLPDAFVYLFAQGFRAARAGIFAEVTGTVEELTGRPPRTLEEFAHDHAGTFAGAAFG